MCFSNLYIGIIVIYFVVGRCQKVSILYHFVSSVTFVLAFVTRRDWRVCDMKKKVKLCNIELMRLEESNRVAH